MLIRGGSSRADHILARETSRPNGTAGPGGTFADLERWLREADLIGIQTEHAAAPLRGRKANRGLRHVDHGLTGTTATVGRAGRCLAQGWGGGPGAG